MLDRAFFSTRCFLGLSCLLAVAGCGSVASSTTAPATASSHSALTEEEMSRRFEQLMSRENGPFERHEVAFLGGRVAGQVESKTAPTVECNDDRCGVTLDMGDDADGDPNSIVCAVSEEHQPLGPYVLGLIGQPTRTTSHQLTTREAGEGLAVMFATNTLTEQDHGATVATPKVAALYAPGFMARCADHQPGGRATFERVVGAFFDGLRSTDAAARSVFSVGYQARHGDQPIGFRFGSIARRLDGEPGYVESSVIFAIGQDDGKWTVRDVVGRVARDASGSVEDMRNNMWAEGKGPLRMSAKQTEGKKMRVKLEIGNNVQALELTPPAPANTETWAAPDLLAVSSGRAASYTYVVPSVEDRDPAFLSVTLRRSAPGVLVETRRENMKKAESGDEIHIDEYGLVTKLVSTTTVTERLYARGELPSLRGRAKPAAASRGAK